MSPSKLPATHSSTGSGASFVTGTIIAIDANHRAQVRLDMGNKVVWARSDLMRAKGVSPKVGEPWILDQPYNGGWMLAATTYAGTDALSWSAATLLGTWANVSTAGVWTPGSGLYSPAGYLQDANAWVTLRGTVSGPAVTNSGAAGPLTADILQLPAGMRPANDGQQRFGVASGTGSGQVMVFPDGYVRALAGTPGSVSLDGITFLAAQ